MRYFALLIFLLFIDSKALSSSLCNQSDLIQYINTSQKLDRSTSPLAFELIKCQSHSIKMQAAFWGVFYFESIKKTSYAVELINRAFPYQKGLTGKPAIILRAQRGDWMPLKTKIDQSDPEYLTDLEAHLVLARSLVFDRQFSEALKIYEQYLQQKPNDDSIDAEYLFTLIWAKDYDGAEARAVQLRKYRIGKRLTQSLDNAENLIFRLRQNRKDIFNTDTRDYMFTGQLAAQFKSKNYSSGSFIQTTSIHFYNRINGELAIHRLKSYQDSKIQDGLEIKIHGRSGVSGLQLSGGAGFLSLEEEAIFGRLQLAFLQKILSFGLSIERYPLSLIYPLPHNQSDHMTDSITIEGNLFQIIDYSTIFAREEDKSSYQHHKIQLSLPIISQGFAQSLSVIFPLKYFSHPKENVYYQTSPQYAYGALGLKYTSSISSAIDLAARVESGLTYLNSYETPKKYEKLLNSAIQLSIIYNTHENFKWFLNFKALDTEEQEYNFFLQNYTQFSVALAYDID